MTTSIGSNDIRLMEQGQGDKIEILPWKKLSLKEPLKNRFRYEKMSFEPRRGRRGKNLRRIHSDALMIFLRSMTKSQAKDHFHSRNPIFQRFINISCPMCPESCILFHASCLMLCIHIDPAFLPC